MAGQRGTKNLAVGVSNLYVAIVTDEDGVYTPQTPFKLADTSLITLDTASSTYTGYYDDKAIISETSEGVTTLTATITGLSLENEAKLLGKVFDATTGKLLDTGDASNAPYVAVSFRGGIDNGGYKYFQYLKAKVSIGTVEFATKNESGIDPRAVQITFSCINTDTQFEVGEGEYSNLKRVTASTAEGYDEGDVWFDVVQHPQVKSLV